MKGLLVFFLLKSWFQVKQNYIENKKVVKREVVVPHLQDNPNPNPMGQTTQVAC
jgi:hypothetical protein